MDEKTNRKLNTIAVIVTVVIVAAAALFVGKSWGEGRLIGERDRLRALNRASVENMIIEESPVYVIGHMSPDSDTVVGAIAYARLLTELGYPAEPAVTMEINNETKWLSQYIQQRGHRRAGRAGWEAFPGLDDTGGVERG